MNKRLRPLIYRSGIYGITKIRRIVLHHRMPLVVCLCVTFFLIIAAFSAPKVYASYSLKTASIIETQLQTVSFLAASDSQKSAASSDSDDIPPGLKRKESTTTTLDNPTTTTTIDEPSTTTTIDVPSTTTTIYTPTPTTTKINPTTTTTILATTTTTLRRSSSSNGASYTPTTSTTNYAPTTTLTIPVPLSTDIPQVLRPAPVSPNAPTKTSNPTSTTVSRAKTMLNPALPINENISPLSSPFWLDYELEDLAEIMSFPELFQPMDLGLDIATHEMQEDTYTLSAEDTSSISSRKASSDTTMTPGSHTDNEASALGNKESFSIIASLLPIVIVMLALTATAGILAKIIKTRTAIKL